MLYLCCPKKVVKTKSVHKGVVKFSKYENEEILLDHNKNSLKYELWSPGSLKTYDLQLTTFGVVPTLAQRKPSSKGGKVKPSHTQTLTTCLADKTNHPVERLSVVAAVAVVRHLGQYISSLQTIWASALEAFRHNPTDGSFAPLVYRPRMCTKCPKLQFLLYWAALLSQLQVISRVKLTCLTTV